MNRGCYDKIYYKLLPWRNFSCIQKVSSFKVLNETKPSDKVKLKIGWRKVAMFEIIKKSIFAGIGALIVTEEKVQDVIADFVQKGELTQKEGETLINELQKVLQDNKAKFTTMIDERVKSIMDDLNMVSKEDLAETEKNIKKEVSKLDKRLAKLEKQLKDQSA
jgi:polyhydroxyalkanoate synthesis regulator phasin